MPSLQAPKENIQYLIEKMVTPECDSGFATPFNAKEMENEEII